MRRFPFPVSRFPVLTRRRRRNAFTLVEVLLVLAILVILGAMVGVGVVQVQRTANKRAAQAQIGMLKETVDLYHVDIGHFPESLDDLRQQPANLRNPDKWHPFLESDLPDDPWGNPYQYEANSDEFRIWSYGPDGTEGGNDDISS
jgi:general secretion pathway protein G